METPKVWVSCEGTESNGERRPRPWGVGGWWVFRGLRGAFLDAGEENRPPLVSEEKGPLDAEKENHPPHPNRRHFIPLLPFE